MYNKTDSIKNLKIDIQSPYYFYPDYINSVPKVIKGFRK